jgi:hypothetical protein
MKEQTSLIKESVRKLYEAKKEKERVDSFYDEVKKKEQIAISNFMFTNLPQEQKSFDIELDEGVAYYTNHVRLQVTRVRRQKVIWLLDKLKKKLSKEMYKDVVKKTYTINDMQGLVRYLKSCGVDAKKFKKFINVSEEADETKLDYLYDTGKLNKKDIAGCYEVQMSEPYIRLTEIKR